MIFIGSKHSNNIVLNEEYLCLEIERYNHGDYYESDKIGLIRDNKIKDIGKLLMKTNQYLLCDKKIGDYDSIINLSLQNSIYCYLF